MWMVIWTNQNAYQRIVSICSSISKTRLWYSIFKRFTDSLKFTLRTQLLGLWIFYRDKSVTFEIVEHFLLKENWVCWRGSHSLFKEIVFFSYNNLLFQTIIPSIFAPAPPSSCWSICRSSRPGTWGPGAGWPTRPGCTCTSVWRCWGWHLPCHAPMLNDTPTYSIKFGFSLKEGGKISISSA